MGEQALRCAATGCNRRARTAGLCAMHYWRAGEGLAEAGEIPPTLDVAHLEASTLCSVEGCGRVRDTGGLCAMHYTRKLRGLENWDDPDAWRTRNPAKRRCSIEGCDRPCDVKNLCKLHYNRKRRGDKDWDSPELRKPGRKPSISATCSVSACDRPPYGHGLCSTHLVCRRAGNPNWSDPIPRPRPAAQEKTPKPGPVSPEIAAELHADYLIARRVNGATPEDSADRDIGRRFNTRIAELAAAGYTHSQIAQAAGASIHMVRRRIARIRVESGLLQPSDCSVNGCNRDAYARGLCRLHYGRQLKGDENWAEPNPRPRGKHARTVELCPNGHPRTPNNLSVNANGVKRCKACKRDAQQRSAPNQRLEITPDMHGTATGWRYGCRCDDCRQQHSRDSQERRWMAVYGPGGRMGPKVRERILGSLEQTGNVKATADEVGVTHQAIYRACSAVPGFGTLVRKLIKPRVSRPE